MQYLSMSFLAALIAVVHYIQEHEATRKKRVIFLLLGTLNTLLRGIIIPKDLHSEL